MLLPTSYRPESQLACKEAETEAAATKDVEARVGTAVDARDSRRQARSQAAQAEQQAEQAAADAIKLIAEVAAAQRPVSSNGTWLASSDAEAAMPGLTARQKRTLLPYGVQFQTEFDCLEGVLLPTLGAHEGIVQTAARPQADGQKKQQSISAAVQDTIASQEVMLQHMESMSSQLRDSIRLQKEQVGETDNAIKNMEAKEMEGWSTAE
jgi:hypothetical protein